MSSSPLLLVHICTGTLGMLSGFGAMAFRKGSRGHRVAGNVFVLSMLCLSISGVILALIRNEPGNVLGGTLTFYLVATAWAIARRGDGETSIFDWGALFISLALGAVIVDYALEAVRSPTGLSHGYPVGPYVFLGLVTILAAVGDVRMLLGGGVRGAKRIARHLWRMCFAWFIASSSIFLARPHLFPAVMRKTGALYLLSVLPLILMIFWLIRVLFWGRRNLHEAEA